MADVKLVTKFVDLGSTGGYGFALYGFRNIGGSFGSFGTLSETANGSSNTTTSYLYSGSTDIKEVYWADQATDTLYFTLDGNRSNSALIWAKLKIGSTTFTRSTASYSYNSSTNRTTWSWATSTNPFGSTTSGTDVAIEVILDVNTGHTSSSGNKTITSGSTSDETYILSNASSNQQYRLIKSSGTIASGGGTGTVIDSRTGGGNLIFDYSNNELPPAGSSATYQLQVSGPYVSDTETESGFWINTTGQSNSITITREAVATPTYSLSVSPTTVNEGSSVTFTVTTTNVANGTTIYWKAIGVPSAGSAGASDYSPTTGSVSISNNSATFTVSITADNTTEGTETFRGQIFTDSSYSTQVGSDTYVTISDTSTTPPSYSVTAPASIDEGSSGTFTVTTTNVSNGTTLYWSLSNPSEFNTAVGTVTINSNSGSFTGTPTADNTTEGAETGTVRVRTGSQGGTVVATDTFTINDTSQGATAPTDITFGTDPGTQSSTVSITATASGGTNGTMFVSDTDPNVSNSVVANGSAFNFTRGTAKTIYAVTSNGGGLSSTYSESFTPDYLTVDTKVDLSPANTTISYTNTSSVSISLTNGTANHRYRLRSGNATVSTILLTGSSGTFTVANSWFPTSPGTATLTLQGRVDTAYGGDNAYDNLGDTVTLTRQDSTVTPPTSITFGSVPATASATVSVTVTATGGTFNTQEVSEDGTNWVANGSSFNFTRGSAKTVYARNVSVAGTNVSSSLTSSLTPAYLAPDLGVSASSSTIAFTATSATTTVSGGQSAETYAVRVEDGSTNLGSRTGNGNISFTSSLPTVGSPTTYEIFARRPTSTGGDGSTFYQTNDTFTVTRSAETVSAPTDITFGSDPGTASATVSITATASGGSGGTLQVSSDGSTWVSNGSSFTFTRGTAKTIYARRLGTGATSSNYTEAHTVGYLSPDTSVTATSSNISSSATSATTTVGSGQSGETYAVRVENGSVNVTNGTRTGNGDITFTGSLPPFASTITYEIFALRPTNLGGSNSYVQTNVTFDVSRAVEAVTAPTDITFSSDPGTASATVSISATASGGSGGTLQVSADGSTWTSNGSSFTFTRGTAKTIYARRLGTGGSTSSNYTEAHTVGYLAGDVKVDLSPTSVTLAHDANSAVSITLTGGSANNDYQIRYGTANLSTLSLSGSSTSGTLTIGTGVHPAVNQTRTYNLYGRRTTSSGGDGTYALLADTVTITRNSESVSAPTDITFSADPGTFSSTVSITATASGGSGGTLKVSDDGSNWDANGTSYTFTRGTARTIYARREGVGANSANYTESHTVSKLATDTSITVSPTSTTVEPNANTSVTVDISNATQQHTYSVFKQTGANSYQSINIDTGTLSGTTGSVTIPNSQLPTAGNSTTYKFFGELPTASGGFGTPQSTNGTFTISRTAEDVTPNDFSFTDFTNVARSTTQTSSTITVGGLSTGTSVAVSVTGGTYSKNYGSYTSSNGTASNGDTFSVRHTSSASFSTNTDTTLTIGNKDDTFRTTTLAADTVPDSFSFTDVTNAPLSAQQTSNEITIAGLNTSTTVSITGGTYSKNSGSYTSSNGTASNGDTFSVRHTTSSSYSTATNTVLNIGGVTDTWSTTTIAEGTTETGDGGGSSTGSGSYGIEVYGPDGETVVWGSNVRQTNMVVFDLITLSASSTQSYTCADANDDTKVIVSVAIPSYIAGPFYQGVYGNLVITKSSTGFSVQNTNSSKDLTVQIVAVRIA